MALLWLAYSKTFLYYIWNLAEKRYMEQWLVTQDKRITLNDFHLSTKKIVQGLFELGVGHGDSVALLLRNGIEFLEVTYAAGLLGAYPVPINWHFKESEIVYILLNSDAKLIVAHTDLATKIPLILENKIPLILVEPSLELQTAYKLKSRGLPPPTLPHKFGIHGKKI